MDWVSVNKQLPELDKDVLLTYSGKVVFGTFLYYDSDDYRWQDNLTRAYLHEVTHWMPLPEPPHSVTK